MAECPEGFRFVADMDDEEFSLTTNESIQATNRHMKSGTCAVCSERLQGWENALQVLRDKLTK